ncbi:MAG TPA: alpha/beta hydrolase [Cytophagales bacterium]|nr:alpha/beta hydrolase [Cytophagales bacterium]HAA23152.1 alpha/beta hydrolase [Cytophagales bacterium]HAP57988.1 alpha/beta hydrolase [Cytophagales bacterium]
MAEIGTSNSRRDLIAPYAYKVNYFEEEDGYKMAYIDIGQGPPVLFIHGLASYLRSWEPNLHYLSNQYRCLAVDLPGFGRSDLGLSQGKLSEIAKKLVDFLDYLELDQVSLLGHSMGGQTAIWASLLEPERIKNLILVAPAGFETFTEQNRLWLKSFYSVDRVMSTSEDQMRKNYGYNFFRLPERVEAWLHDRMVIREAADFEQYAQAVVQSWAGMLNEPVFDRLAELTMPTLVVYGEEDFLIPNRNLHPELDTRTVAERGIAQIPNGQLVMVPQAGHFVHFEQPDRFHQAVIPFLASTAAS